MSVYGWNILLRVWVYTTHGAWRGRHAMPEYESMRGHMGGGLRECPKNCGVCVVTHCVYGNTPPVDKFCKVHPPVYRGQSVHRGESTGQHRLWLRGGRLRGRRAAPPCPNTSRCSRIGGGGAAFMAGIYEPRVYAHTHQSMAKRCPSTSRCSRPEQIQSTARTHQIAAVRGEGGTPVRAGCT